MSIVHYIETNEVLDFRLLQRIIERSLPDVAYEQRAENLCYFWIDGQSTRGVDVSLEEDRLVEIRNTGLSNTADYTLTNQIAESICNLYQGKLMVENEDYDEDNPDNEPAFFSKERPIYSKEEMLQIQEDDSISIQTLVLQLQEDITVFGPIHRVNIGKNTLSKIATESDDVLTHSLIKLIKHINYDLPDYEYGNVLEITKEDQVLTLKLITNETPCIIDKYDYILFQISEEELIAITNDDLIKVMPKIWDLVDEYTIVAPILSDAEFDTLKNKAKVFNRFDELR